jgi:murein DD-endopeptidase MepM/ murein hydrolase activator NlpD
MGKWYLSTRLVALVAVMALSTGVLGATAAFPQPTSETAVADQAAGGAANAPTAQLTPLVVSTFARPHPVLGTDNRIHLAYELQLSNIAATTLTIDRVQVLDPSRDARVVDELSGEELASRLIVFGSSPTSPPTKQFGPGVGGFLFMDVTYRKGERLPDRLKYRFKVSTSEDAGSDNSFPAGPTLVAQDDPVVVGAPLSGKRWLAGEGCCETITSHRGAIFPIDGTFHSPERFAIDWVQVGTNGKLWKGPRDELSSYPYYGAKVRSVAAGRVVATRDDLEEQTPGTSPSGLALEEYGGNHVTVDIGDGRYAYYAHLQKGDEGVLVERGDRVREGQVIGKLGNTGNTDAPHLHFHIMDGPSVLLSNGLPFEIESFRTVGRLTNYDAFQEGASAKISPEQSGEHRRKLPLHRTVNNFR